MLQLEVAGTAGDDDWEAEDVNAHAQQAEAEDCEEATVVAAVTW